jgi:hypothetical protein
MKRLTISILAALTLALAFCSTASAAAGIGFAEAAHEGTVSRNDEAVFYSVRLKNTGNAKSSPGAFVTIALPPGLAMAAGSGEGWTCVVAEATCTSSKEVEPNLNYPQLRIMARIFPEAPETVLASFGAGPGALNSDVFASDSFSFGPAVPFAVTGLTAGACKVSAAAGESLHSCAEAEAAGGAPETQAGAHPFAATSSFAFATHVNANGSRSVVEALRDLVVSLPPGLIGNPRGVGSVCTFTQVAQTEATEFCPSSAAVGGIATEPRGFPGGIQPIYRIAPEEGYVAAFAFHPIAVAGPTLALRVKLRSNGDYGVSAVSPLPPQAPELLRVTNATLCGYGAKVLPGIGANAQFTGCRQPGNPGAKTVPFLTNPTSCVGGPPVTTTAADSYENPGAQVEGLPDLADSRWKVAETTSPAITGCQALTESWVGEGPEPHEPSFEFTPDTTQAGAPAAFAAHLHIPQGGLVSRTGLGTPHLKKTTVKLPAGVALNPAAAAGLEACSEAQIGYVGNEFPAPNPIHFNGTPPDCPPGSRLATVEASTPVLDKPLHGTIYLAAQDANPLGSRFALYLAIEDRETGIYAKLPGRVVPDEQNGQITASFDNNPQVPVEDLRVDFFKGPQASLVNPDVCGGAYNTETELTPWSAADPDHPTLAEVATSTSPVTIESPPEGASSCPAGKAERPFAPTFSAGVTDPTAGAHSPFTLRMTRPNGAQEFSSVDVITPPGFAATLRGVTTCPWSSIEAAANRVKGAEEIAHPSCPASSQVGATTIGAGAGPNPYYVKTGHAYLTGPYKGAPLSLTFIVPAVAGPFDLGVQTVKTALYVNPATAQITAKSDPIPQILDGVPLDIRDIRVDVSRSGFALNPTNCDPMAVSATVTGSSGGVANLSNGFQVGNCGALGFKPGLKIQLHGGTGRGDYQRLQATVTYPEKGSYANIARAAVTLPHSEFLAQEHIRTVCTRVQFAAHQCPQASIYGHATAVTPLLEQPLSGPVYLRSSDNLLPDLVVALKGPDSMPIEVELDGRTDSKHGGIRNTFEMVPDAPVSKFTLELQGGKKSLIVNSRDLCKGSKQRATARFDAQNGKTHNFRPVVGNDCGKSQRKAKHRRARRGGALGRLAKSW